MTPLAWAAAHPFLSSALILAAGFTAGYLVVGPAFFRPLPVPAPPRCCRPRSRRTGIPRARPRGVTGITGRP